MLNISQIKKNNILSPAKQITKKQEENFVQPQKNQNAGAYPSSDLLKSMAGIQPTKPLEDKKVKQADNEQIEQINKYLHSLPITGQVISAYEQDEEGKLAVQGLVNAMSKNDVETSNVEMLLDLVENKKVNYSALLYLCNQGIMSDEFESDLDKLYDAYINKKDIKEAFVPTMKNCDEASKNSQIGEVFQIDGEENIYIKTSDNELKQLKMTRDTYLKLFPPLERFALYQGDAGNCYMLSTLDAINSNPKTREKLLSCFEESGDKLNVSLPNSDYVFTMNKNKMPAEIKDFREQFSMGAAGFKILEHVYGKTVQHEVTKQAHEILKEQSQTAKGFFTKRMFKKQLASFEEELAKNPDNIILDRKLSDQSVSWNESIGVEWKKLDEISTEFKRASDYYRGRGGHEEWVMQSFGFTDIEKIFDIDSANSEKLQKMFFDSAENNEYIFTACSAKQEQKLSSAEGLVDVDYGVYSKHSFSVKPKIDANGNKMLHVSNPWNSTQSTVMSFEKFCELYSFVIVAKK